MFLFDNKKRGWGVFAVTFIINIVCKKYFFTENFGLIDYPARNNFLYDFVFFSAGGLIYLYKYEIEKLLEKRIPLFCIFAVIMTILYYFLPNSDILFTLEMVLVFSLWLMIAISKKNSFLLDNKLTRFISKISMEMYLSHMIVFRLVDKFCVTRWVKAGYISYVITVIIVIVGTVLFTAILNKIIAIIEEKANCITNNTMKDNN